MGFKFFRKENQLEEIGQLFPESTIKKVLHLPKPERVRRIGQRNRAVLRYLCRHKTNAEIDEHNIFKDWNALKDGVPDMDRDECSYRLAFVVSIGLVRSLFKKKGERIYEIDDELCHLL